jgi:hypothetical protein
MTVENTLLWQIALGISAVLVIVGAIFKMYNVTKRIDQAIGTDSKGRTLSERMDRVEHQLWENHGSSLADRVNDIKTQSITTAAEIAIIKDIVLKLVVAD